MPSVKHIGLGTELFTGCAKETMQNNRDKREESTGKQPSQMDSFNQHNEEKSTATEDVKKQKDESESYMDYNGNSEENAPARARE